MECRGTIAASVFRPGLLSFFSHKKSAVHRDVIADVSDQVGHANSFAASTEASAQVHPNGFHDAPPQAAGVMGGGGSSLHHTRVAQSCCQEAEGKKRDQNVRRGPRMRRGRESSITGRCKSVPSNKQSSYILVWAERARGGVIRLLRHASAVVCAVCCATADYFILGRPESMHSECCWSL